MFNRLGLYCYYSDINYFAIVILLRINEGSEAKLSCCLISSSLQILTHSLRLWKAFGDVGGHY